MSAPEELNDVSESLFSEGAILWKMMSDPRSIPTITSSLSPDAFSFELNRLTFQAVSKMYSSTRTIDPVAVAESIAKERARFPVGVVLDNVLTYRNSSGNFNFHIKDINEKYARRMLSKAGSMLDKMSRDDDPDSSKKIISVAKDNILSAEKITREQDTDVVSVSEASKEFAEILTKRMMNSGDDIIRTRLKAIDDRIVGYGGGDLIIIGGRPGAGKTALAMSNIESIAFDQDLPVVVFSMEMNEKKLVGRMLASRAGINAHSLKMGKLSVSEIKKLNEEASSMINKKLYIDQNKRLTPSHVNSVASKYSKKFGRLGAIMIDYSQLMQSDEVHTNEVDRIAAISRELKLTGLEYNCPVIVLSQLNRSIEKRMLKDINAKPVSADLRGSGGLEQDADTIIIVHRPEKYYPDVKELEGYGELVFTKVREGGSVGVSPIAWVGEHTRFQDISKEDSQQALRYMLEKSNSLGLNNE